MVCFFIQIHDLLTDWAMFIKHCVLFKNNKNCWVQNLHLQLIQDLNGNRKILEWVIDLIYLVASFMLIQYHVVQNDNAGKNIFN